MKLKGDVFDDGFWNIRVKKITNRALVISELNLILILIQMILLIIL